MNQLSLSIDFEPLAHARAVDPLTSHDAAERASSFASSHAAIVHAMLKKHGPQTPHEIASRVKLDSVQITRRLADLKALKMAEPIEGETRMTPSGCKARVWKAVAA